MRVLPLYPHIHLLKPSVMAFGGGVLGKWVGHEGGALINGMNTHIEETTESALNPATKKLGHL